MTMLEEIEKRAQILKREKEYESEQTAILKAIYISK